jgi:hypothetical protein
MIEDLDDVLEAKWNEGELLNPCECGQHHVEITEQDFEWQKRDLWIAEFTYLCWECDAVWIERMWLRAQISEYKMIKKGRIGEEE